MITMRAIIGTAFLLAGLSQAAPHQSHSQPNGKIDLNALAQRAGKLWFGTAADIPGTAETTDQAYLKILQQNFGEITPANAMKVLSNFFTKKCVTRAKIWLL
jgi:endo-1,4-beta-xylanase